MEEKYSKMWFYRTWKKLTVAIKFFLILWFLPTETYNLLQIAEESSEM